MRIDRRHFLGGVAAGALSATLPSFVHASQDQGVAKQAGQANADAPLRLAAGEGNVSIVGGDYPDTAVWCYNGTVPGPALRARQGDRVRFLVDNRLAEGTSVHCHGIRLDNAMDGVPHLTQAPIGPGESFAYEFLARDAGTFWFHPHANSPEQVGRGLYGAIVIEEESPPEVDRDLVWVLDDWRLGEDAQILPGFDALHDMAHGGRFGNVPTINGKLMEDFPVRSGERIRLRLINAANARIFTLDFQEHTPWLIALDGHPQPPYSLQGKFLPLGPGMRADLIIDMTGKAGARHAVVDRSDPRSAYRLVELAYEDAPPLRRESPPPPARLAANPVTPPDLKQAARFDMAFSGGAMGRMMGAMVGDQHMDMREMAGQGLVWAINGRVFMPDGERPADPMLDLKLGESYILRLRNDTSWPHPIHLHGHSFHVISRRGEKLERPFLQDTVLMSPGEDVEIAFVADNPGDWMLHCHILEHAASGMKGFVRVA